jgi:SAM-dependent methyltransferase
MTQRSVEEVRGAVQAAYGARAQEVLSGGSASCCDSSCCGDVAADAKEQFYAATETDGLPESVVSYGCGNPTAIAGLQPGETVLDLGSGAGMDCFLAARQVGPEGHVIGLDMTDAMIELATTNQRRER